MLKRQYLSNTPIDTYDEFYIGKITPVIHYCMGGLEINTETKVINKNKKVISRLYAVGENQQVFIVIID